jgi:hypothetical protein
VIQIPIPGFIVRFLARREACKRRIADPEKSAPSSKEGRAVGDNLFRSRQSTETHWIRPRQFSGSWSRQNQANEFRSPFAIKLDEALDRIFRGKN